MPQNEYIEQHIKQHGRRLDHEEKKRKKEAREGHRIAKDAQRLTGWRGKQFAAKRRIEKIEMKKKIRAHEESKVKGPSKPKIDEGEALPAYLLDRQEQNTAKAISSSIKQKRLEKADKFSVPLPKVRGISEEEMFKVVKTGKKTKKKAWKRMITKHTFVGENFTRKPAKMERIIRPSALRQKKANVTHPELKVTVFLPILGVKKNPQSPMYTQLGVLTKGTIIEVNVSELGLVTPGGKVVWGKYAQITNEPDRDGCVNAVLLV
ncbi:rRNA-processing protein [Saccharomycopsis crataegensis]|uniref:Ribosome biogenesis protein NSA2 homolog n=1 Tax=Saccharomycopsis crataegensis TaxID=43959 RepID=A0AAV5QPJ1_9ASCO|nr:rRNA-processing protein [Saccharomycopsis crataegensis]